ncbi:single-stranded DNA-binding protein [Anaerotignum sp.]|uniref:single-stranded DNA-binding protein n=1 Tax=Anaerotignum sp. TaxID=2039241 RepID=UPI0028B0E61A|nr:single-stranded DNA-binding protein [Anaerotignum sp.]
MSQSYTIGRVTADFELQRSVNDVPYVRFSLAEKLGHGEYARTQYLQVWAWREDAIRLINRKVKKGSLLWVSGSLELETYQKRDAQTKDKRLKVTLDNWGFVPGGKASASPTDSEAPNLSSSPDDAKQAMPDSEIDGDREPLPG